MHLLDCCEYAVGKLVKFLFHYQDYSHRHLNTSRSSVASVFKHIHPDKPATATSQRIQDFFAAKRRKTVKIPSIQDMGHRLTGSLYQETLVEK